MAPLSYPPPLSARDYPAPIWLYLRFTLNYRDVLRNGAAMGAEVRSCNRATAAPAPPSAERSLALDEIMVRIAGERMYLWRAVDHEGEVLDMRLTARAESYRAEWTGNIIGFGQRPVL